MRTVNSLLLAACCALFETACSGGTPQPDKIKPFKFEGTVEHKEISEMSGIGCSRAHPGVYWVHNDSGDSPRLFAIDGSGSVVIPSSLSGRYAANKTERGKKLWPGLNVESAKHVDWEDITLADGKLYIADTGNNSNNRQDLVVYQLKEPDPREAVRVEVLARYPISFPDQKQFPAKNWHFDLESMFFFQGRLYFLTKHRVAGKSRRYESGTKLYRLDTTYSDKDNLLTLIGTHSDLGVPTGAELSPDKKRLAVVTTKGIWIFEKPPSSDNFLKGKSYQLGFPEELEWAEGICWDDDQTLRVVREKRDIYTVSTTAFRKVTM